MKKTYKQHAHLHLFLLLIIITRTPRPLFFLPPPLARNEFFQPIYLYSSVTRALWMQCVSCRHRPPLVWTLWGFKKRQRGKKKKKSKKKKKRKKHLFLCVSSSSSAAAAARHQRIMQHLKPWRALLLLTVLWQPGMSDKYGKLVVTVMRMMRMMMLKAELWLVCFPQVHGVPFMTL